MDHGYHAETLDRSRPFRQALAGLAVAAMITAWAGPAGAGGLADSGHDFSMRTAGLAESCVVCHTPSAAQSRATDGLASPTSPVLPASPSPGGASTADHDSPRATSFAGAAAESRPCLGCHDGSVAPDSLTHRPAGFGVVASPVSGSGARIGKGHPVFVVYDGALARGDRGLFDPAITPSGLGGTIKEDMLVDSQIVCSSCHGVHDQSGRGDFLRISNDGSRLCLTCHDL